MIHNKHIESIVLLAIQASTIFIAWRYDAMILGTAINVSAFYLLVRHDKRINKEVQVDSHYEFGE